MRFVFILFSAFLCFTTSAQVIIDDGQGRDTSLYKVSFYIDDTLQNTPTDIYYVDSNNRRIINPDQFLCDTCDFKLYYKHNLKDTVAVVCTNSNYKIAYSDFRMFSTTTEIEFGIIKRPQKLIRVLSDQDISELQSNEKDIAKHTYYSLDKRHEFFFYNLTNKVKYIQYIYVSSNTLVGPFIFYNYIY